MTQTKKMRQQVTEIEFMNWINEHWGWLGAVILVVFKFGQDHLRINRLQEDVKESNKRIKVMEDMEIRRADTVARIETKIDFLIDQVKGNTQDIKGMQSK